MQNNGPMSVFQRRTLSILCAVALTTVGILAARTIANHRRAAADFDRFRISSNYLTEDGAASYTVQDWGGGFDILLYNYEPDNIQKIASVPMSYLASAQHASVSVKNQRGDSLVPADNDGSYTFPTESMNSCHVLHVTPEPDAPDPILVTVQTTAPYVKTLSAAFQVRKFRPPDYTAQDLGDGSVRLSIQTNDYQETISVSWDPEKLSPDSTDERVDWSPSFAYFQVDSNSTWDLLFFKCADLPYPLQTGSATVIRLD